MGKRIGSVDADTAQDFTLMIFVATRTADSFQSLAVAPGSELMWRANMTADRLSVTMLGVMQAADAAGRNAGSGDGDRCGC